MNNIETKKLPVTFQQPGSFEVEILDSKIRSEGILIRHIAVQKRQIWVQRSRVTCSLVF